MTAQVSSRTAPTTIAVLPAPASADGRRPAARPLGGGVLAGLVASACCGGSLIFGTIGLGTFYSGLGTSRYIPQALALGALLITGINYWYYRHQALRATAGELDCACRDLRRSMLVSAALGLLVMAGSFVFLEWLNHAVVNGERFLEASPAAQTAQSTSAGQPPAAAGAGHPRESGHPASGSQTSEPSTGGSRVASAHAAGLIPGVANRNLLFALASFAALGVLALLPFPRRLAEAPAAAAGAPAPAHPDATQAADLRAEHVTQAPGGHCPF